MKEHILPREQKLASKLYELFDSGAVLVVMSTLEEQCAERIARTVAKKLEKELYVWDSVGGFRDGKSGGKSETTDPVEALSRLKNVPGAVALIKDYYKFFNEPRCVRALKDNLIHAPEKSPFTILLMPYHHVPDELSKEATYLSLPLPDGAELQMVLKSVLHSAKKKLDEKDLERASVSAAGLTAAQAARIFKQASSSLPTDTEAFLYSILSEKRSITRQALALEFLDPKINFDSVGGLELLKKWLTSRTAAFTSKAEAYGLPTPRGLLLLGVQGCGKSISAKSVAELWKLPLLRLDLSRIDPVSGESMLIEALKTSEAVAPSVLWIDEIEKGFGGTGKISAGVSLRALSSFITWLQEKTVAVYVVATANSIRQMPPELLRKGRFDEVFFVDLPSSNERIEIFKIHLMKRKRNPDAYRLEALAAESDGFSGAEIEAVVISGMFEAFSEDRDVTTDDILYAIRTTIPLSTTMEEEIQELRDWARGRARPASYDTRLADLLVSQKPMEEEGAE